MSKDKKKSGCGTLILIAVVVFVIAASMSSTESFPEDSNGQAKPQPKKQVSTSNETAQKNTAPRAVTLNYPTPSFEELAYQRQNWPSAVQLLEPISSPIIVDGQEVGEQTFPRNTIAKIRSANARESTLTLDANGTVLTVPVSNTDFIESAHLLIKNMTDLEIAAKQQQEAEAVRLAEEEAENLRQIAIRKKKAAEQFSTWDGSHNPSKRLLKRALKDPDSLKIIEPTRYWALPNKVVVKFDYRAKNSFGGYVIESFAADFDYEGRLIKLHEQD